VPPSANAKPAKPNGSARPTTRPSPELMAEFQAAVREDKCRTRAEARAVELERPGWWRELGERPASINVVAPRIERWNRW
jgi:hypothetical protein